MNEILRLENVSKAFGGVVVADQLSYSISKGEALGVIGPNGAGKTSMFNLITGTVKPDSGRVFFQGEPITQTTSVYRARNGIARSFQVPQPFTGLTVFENALVAATQAAGQKGKVAERCCIEILEQTGLLPQANILAGKLTLLDRKRLELARSLCAKPKLLLLDEIAGGLTQHECVALINTIRKIWQSGVTIIWIEHVVHALLEIVERLIVIDFGKKIAEGEPRAIMNSRAVKEIYLGVEAHA